MPPPLAPYQQDFELLDGLSTSALADDGWLVFGIVYDTDATTFLGQELAIITGACDAMVVDIQCIMQNIANVAECFHTKLITTHPIAKMEQDSVIHIEFDEHYAMEDAEKIVRMGIDNFQNRSSEVMIPQQKATQIAGFTEAEANRFFGRPPETIVAGRRIAPRPPVEVRAAFTRRHAELLREIG